MSPRTEQRPTILSERLVIRIDRNSIGRRLLLGKTNMITYTITSLIIHFLLGY